MQTADEILAHAKRLPPDERRRVAEELLAELDETEGEEAVAPEKGPYRRWLDAAGSVSSDYSDVSTDKYKHVAAASLHGRDDE